MAAAASAAVSELKGTRKEYKAAASAFAFAAASSAAAFATASARAAIGSVVGPATLGSSVGSAVGGDVAPGEGAAVGSAVGCEVSPAVVGSASSAARMRSPHFKRSARMNLLRAACPSGKNASSVKPSCSRCRTPSRLSPATFFHWPERSYSSIRTPTNAQTLSMAAWSVTVRSPIRDFSRKWLNTRAVVRAQSPWCLAICGWLHAPSPTPGLPKMAG
jgi:hypothetical protein